jgi:phosphoglucosamine mutase
VVEALRGEALSFGGRASGHLIFMDPRHDRRRLGRGAAGARDHGRRAEEPGELAHVMERVPQVLESIKLPARRPLEQMLELTSRIGAAEKKLGRDGRVLVRWSGTEAKLRLMVEGPNPKVLQALVDDMADARAQETTAARGDRHSTGTRDVARLTRPEYSSRSYRLCASARSTRFCVASVARRRTS